MSNWAEYDANSMYPQAGANAQPEVQAAIGRFRQLPDMERAQLPLLYWLIGSGTMPYKMSKTDAQYVDPSPSPSHKCENCRHSWASVKHGFHICDLMRGHIRGSAVCALWEA